MIKKMRNLTFLIYILGFLIHFKAFLSEVLGAKNVDLMFSVTSMLWSLCPYFLLLLLGVFKKNLTIGVMCASVIVVILDFINHLEVYYHPSSSTSSLVLLFMPLWDLILIIPITCFIGYLIQKKILKEPRGQA
jgi:hypothetical protein